jgi:hypothetical protein
VFFDNLRIKWLYENEGFDLDGLRYLPDFDFPNHKCFVEIKGEALKTTDREKLKRLAYMSGKTAIVIIGLPGEEIIEGYMPLRGDIVHLELRWKCCKRGCVGFGPIEHDNEVWFTEGAYDYNVCDLELCQEIEEFKGKFDYVHSERLKKACNAARSERFGT